MVSVKVKETKIHQLISCGVKSMEFILREAERLIQTHKTRNPFEIADCLNINVLYRPLGKLKGKGFTYAQGGADISALTMNWTVLPND